MGLPLYLLVLHDWSKFLADEWFAYADVFREGSAGPYYAKSDKFDAAFLRHCARNKHHWQHWAGAEIPARYRQEMLADWRAAGRASGRPDTLNWYMLHHDQIQLHANTRRWLETKLMYDRILESRRGRYADYS